MNVLLKEKFYWLMVIVKPAQIIQKLMINKEHALQIFAKIQLRFYLSMENARLVKILPNLTQITKIASL